MKSYLYSIRIAFCLFFIRKIFTVDKTTLTCFAYSKITQYVNLLLDSKKAWFHNVMFIKVGIEKLFCKKFYSIII